MTSPERVLAAAQEMDRVCRELAWWTKPVAPPDELTFAARHAIRVFRIRHYEYDGSGSLPPLADDGVDV